MRERGFTVLELAVAAVILIILAGLAIIGYNQVIAQTKRKTAVSRLLKIAHAQETFRLRTARYATLEELRSRGYVTDDVVRFDSGGRQQPIDDMTVEVIISYGRFDAFLVERGKRRICVDSTGVTRRVSSPDSTICSGDVYE